jgi:hypothetical protein
MASLTISKTVTKMVFLTTRKTKTITIFPITLKAQLQTLKPLHKVLALKQQDNLSLFRSSHLPLLIRPHLLRFLLHTAKLHVISTPHIHMPTSTKNQTSKTL